jgi:adenosine tuberculosinyltransferase
MQTMQVKLSFAEFIELPDEAVAQLMQGPKTCLLGLNGTTRWYFLESLNLPQDRSLKTYTEITSQRLAEICDLAFSHGMHTLLIPLLNQTLFAGRSSQYAQMMLEALPNITSGGCMDEVYERHQVKVGFYGDYKRVLESSDNGRLLDSFSQTARATQPNNGPQILWGIFAQDEATTVINTTVDYYQAQQKRPGAADLVRHYYGGDVSLVDIYITSGKPRLFDAPFLLTGRADLYFMTSPTLYLSRNLLRKILYDHLYSRKNEKKYSELNETDWQSIGEFYETNRNTVIGVGAAHPDWGIWCPQTTPVLPEDKPPM